MHKVDVLAYKFDVDNTDSFNEDIISYSRNSIILNWSLKKIWVQYKPANIEFKKTTMNFFNIREQKWRYFFSPLITIVYVIQVFKFFLPICWKFRPKIFVVENFVEGLIAGIIRKCNLVDKTIYLPADWFAGHKYKKLLSNIANNLLFPCVDYWACKLNDVVIDRQGFDITEMRNKYWGMKIPTTKRQFIQQLRIQTTNICIDKKRPNICFIGEVRKDSGLDIAIKSLGNILKHQNTVLKIIGHKRLYYDYFINLSKEYDVTRYVKFLGFVERKDFNQVLSDCFCGINILSNLNSYSTVGCPAKITYYLQYLLPVIVTEGIGERMLLDIRNNKLGLIIRPTEDEFVEAVLKIYNDQNFYRKNIVSYIKSFPKTGIIDFLRDEDLKSKQ